MSVSVVKQALQLMQEDLQTNDGPVAASVKKKSRTKNAMKLIKTNRKGVWKELRRLQKREQEKMKSNFEKPNFKSNIEKFKEDQVASTVKKMPRRHVVEPGKNAKKVFEYHLKNLNRRKHTDDGEEKEESTVFTDRDFDKFEEEYDFFN